MGVPCTVVYVATELPEHLRGVPNIVLFQPIKGALSAFVAQSVRLVYPCLMDCADGILISDIDMIPLRKEYFTEPIANIPDNKFVSYRDVMLHLNEIAICYNVASPQTWREVMKVHSLDTARDRIAIWSKVTTSAGKEGTAGWSLDQKVLYASVIRWGHNPFRVCMLSDSVTKFRRLDRSCTDSKRQNAIMYHLIRAGYYSDFHMQRPWEVSSDNNMFAINAITKKYDTTQVLTPESVIRILEIVLKHTCLRAIGEDRNESAEFIDGIWDTIAEMDGVAVPHARFITPKLMFKTKVAVSRTGVLDTFPDGCVVLKFGNLTAVTHNADIVDVLRRVFPRDATQYISSPVALIPFCVVSNRDQITVADIHSQNDGDTSIAIFTLRFLLRYRDWCKDRVCVDVGAAKGWWTLLCASRGFNVIAFEPDAQSLAGLHINLQRNMESYPGWGAKIYPIAVSDSKGAAQFSACGEISHLLSRAESTKETVVNSRLVTMAATDTLDSILGDSAKVALIKIDTEGNEEMVIAGAEKLLLSGRVGGIIMEFTVFWMGKTTDECTRRSVDLLKKIHTTHPLIYHASRRGRTYMAGPIMPAQFESFVKDLQDKHLQTDIMALCEPV